MRLAKTITRDASMALHLSKAITWDVSMALRLNEAIIWDVSMALRFFRAEIGLSCTEIVSQRQKESHTL